MEKIRENKALNESIDWIRNNPYTEEIINISDVELLNTEKRVCVSIYQGDYPVDVKFTEMQKVEVTYRNKNFGLRKDIIVAGFDAVRYKEAYTSLYEGQRLSDRIISVEFIGEYAKNIETITLEEKED